MIETTSGGSFDHDQTKHIQNRGWMRRRGEWPKDPKLDLVKIRADEEIQRQLSAVGRKHNIWENIAAKPITTVTSVQHRNAKPKFTTWNKSTKKQKI